ncbi:MAG TPA: hypothetical protein VKG23_20155 [Thermoanaerobaculia bacterium]|nr:hypothetical protein [Thermoanaerobaculia bacterium]
MSDAVSRAPESQIWIHSKRFDLLFLTLSGALVFFPYLSYGLLQDLGVSTATASLIVGLSVTVLVGGPHMYSTFLRTTLEPRFRQRYGLLTYLPLVVIPTLVIMGALYNFLLLLTGFFLWASLHVTHQAQYISETYRMRAGASVRALDRWLDGAVILGALYLLAMYKFTANRFALGDSVLLFPSFLKHRWVAVGFTVGYAAFFLFYVFRVWREIRRGESSWPRLLFMTMTVAMSMVVPLFDNLDVSFQGFNTWHSLQYLALTWFILGREAATGRIGNKFVRGLAGDRKTLRFYAATIGATMSAGGLYLIVWKGLGFAQDKSYYAVTLSFLLCHYFYDHILFRDFEPLEPLRSRERVAA